MNVQPIHQLAVGLRTNPGLTACLLGSGISRAAGVPTGWEVVLDMVRRHAAMLGDEQSAKADPAAWYAARYGHEPDYSDLVTALAPASELRRSLLEEYFMRLDAASGERHEHEPTAAHRAIAQLVKRRLLRVIITTNFDRLMEHALGDAGVARIEVVSTATEAANCYPFHASDAFIFKLHGDWRDLDLRNSRDELASYPDAIETLLTRILDEHALIVCGWSAEYDTALRQALQRYHRRFPVHWVDPHLNDHASRLCAALKGTPLVFLADQFFEELESAVNTLDRVGPSERLKGDVLVLRARRAIENERKIEIESLLQSATHELTTWIAQRIDSAPDSAEAQAAQLDAAERASEPLCRLVAALAHYGVADRPSADSVSRLLLAAQERLRWRDWLDPVATYPAILVMFSWAIVRASTDDWTSTITGIVRAGKAGLGELTFPPGSNKRLSPYRELHLMDRYKDSPQEMLGDRIANAVYGFCSDWIVRKSELDELYDRVDMLVAVRSFQIGEWWIPRCMVDRGVGGDFPRFKEIFDDWLTPLTNHQDMSILLADLSKPATEILGALSEFARQQQRQWPS